MSGPRIDWLVPCEQVLQDQSSQRLTIINALDQIALLEVPVLLPKFGLAAQLHWDGGRPDEASSYEYRIVRFSEGGAKETIFRGSDVWSSDRSHAKLFQNYGVLRVPRFETIWFRLDLRAAGTGRWRHGPKVPVDVVPLPISDEQRAELQARWMVIAEELAPKGQ